MNHVFEFCLQDKLGPNGLTAEVFSRYLHAAGQDADALRRAHDEGTLPHLAAVLRNDDLAIIEETASRIRSSARDVLICGTGGSSLGGQVLAQAAGWRSPITCAPPNGGPNLHFVHNLDAASWERLLHGLDLSATHVLAISKSGGTAETLMQVLLAADALERAGLTLKDHITGLSDPAMQGNANKLRGFLSGRGVPVLDHAPGIGGRYAGVTNVGLLPGALAGLDIRAVRAGAGEIASAFLEASSAEPCAPVAGAALNAAFALEKGCHMSVLMVYADSLERFTKWFVQLWAESLGKQGKGTTPLGAIGPLDQHSQLQLYLDGPRDKLFTFIQTQARGAGSRVDATLAGEAGAKEMAGRSPGDLVDSMQRATVETLVQNGRPVRTLQIDSVTGRTVGALMMHFILETIITAHLFKVDPFDQPAVEQGKRLAQDYLAGK